MYDLTPRIVKPVIERAGRAKLHRRATIHGSVGIDWPLTSRITLNRLTVANLPWAHGPKVAVRQLRARLALLPLFHGHVLLSSLVLRRPRAWSPFRGPSPARSWARARACSTVYPRKLLTAARISLKNIPYSHGDGVRHEPPAAG